MHLDQLVCYKTILFFSQHCINVQVTCGGWWGPVPLGPPKFGPGYPYYKPRTKVRRPCKGLKTARYNRKPAKLVFRFIGMNVWKQKGTKTSYKGRSSPVKRSERNPIFGRETSGRRRLGARTFGRCVIWARGHSGAKYVQTHF